MSEVDAREAALKRDARRGFRRLLGLLLVCLLLALAWTMTPLREHLDVARMVALLRQQGEWLGLPGGLLLFALASIVGIPLSFLTVVAVAAYPPLAAYGCCALGACLGGAVSHRLGAWLGAGFIRHLAGDAVRRASQRLGERGIPAVILIRLLPVAPFAVVNMLIGASHISLRDLLVGTWLGVTPAVVLLILFFDRLVAWLGY